MQWYETGLIALTVLGAGSVFVLTPKTWMRWVFVVATLVAFSLHQRYEGPYWQALPLYVATAIIVVIQFASLGESEDAPSLKIGAWVALALCFMSVVLSTVLPMFRLPRPTGPYRAGTYSETVYDKSRAEDGISRGQADHWRELPVQVWYPAEAKSGSRLELYSNSSELNLLASYKALIRTNSFIRAKPLDGKHPVLIFGPRWNGARVQDTFLAEDLASRGYIVVAVDHPYNAALALTDEGVIHSDRASAVSIGPHSTAQNVEAKWAKELTIWVADDRAVLNDLQFPYATPLDPIDRARRWMGLYGHADMARVGAFGHSFGGAAAMALLGVDPRVKCAVNMDGWTFNGLANRTSEPVLFVYEGGSEVRRPEVGVEGELDRADEAAVDGSFARYGGLRAYVAGTQHMDFTDQTLVSPIQRLTYTGPIKGSRVREITRGLVGGFFDRNLVGRGQIPTYPEVKTMQSLPGGEQGGVRPLAN